MKAAKPAFSQDENTVTAVAGGTKAVFCRRSGTLCELVMNGKTILQYSLGETQTMATAEYIKYFLGGEGNNAYYPFLKSKEEIAVVELKYTMQDGNEERERSDSVVSFKSDGRWYPLTGVQVIDSMLGMN